jgi:hypothetical protein
MCEVHGAHVDTGGFPTEKVGVGVGGGLPRSGAMASLGSRCMLLVVDEITPTGGQTAQTTAAGGQSGILLWRRAIRLVIYRRHKFMCKGLCSNVHFPRPDVGSGHFDLVSCPTNTDHRTGCLRGIRRTRDWVCDSSRTPPMSKCPSDS